MDTIADIVLLLSLVLLVVGLIKPTAFANKRKGTVPTRKGLGIGFGIVIVICLITLATNAPKPKTNNTTLDVSTTKAATSDKTSSAATASTNTQSVSAGTTPALRQDLAFQGDATYCNGIYKDNGNGTTTWSLDVKQSGEIITHLSDNSGHIYRHDDQVKTGYYAYTAPVAINDVSEINGVLYIGSDTHPCNISPQQQPQQAY